VKRFRFILMAALAAVVVGTLLAYWLNPPTRLPLVEDTRGQEVDADGRPRVRGLTYTQVKDGVRQWTLYAKGARYDEPNNQVTLFDVRLEFYRPKGDTIHLKGDQGEYDQKNQVVTLRGNVVGRTQDGMTLVTEVLHYSENQQVVFTDAVVNMKGPRFDVTGKGMVVVVPQNKMTLKSQVDSTFIPQGKGPPPGVTVDEPEPQTPAGGRP